MFPIIGTLVLNANRTVSFKFVQNECLYFTCPVFPKDLALQTPDQVDTANDFFIGETANSSGLDQYLPSPWKAQTVEGTDGKLRAQL